MDSPPSAAGVSLAGPARPTGSVPADRHRLRTLAVLASPVAGAGGGPPLGPPLDLWGEWERLAEGLGARDATDGGAAPWAVGRLPSPTAEALADELVQGDGAGYQVLHLAAHGCPEGLVLEDRLGRETLLPTADLVAALRGRGVRLAVLNACETVDVARALVEQGAVAAAIATRESIYDEESKALTRRLYRRLAQGEPVATAVAAACQEIRQVAAERLAHLKLDPAARADNLVLVGDGRVRLMVEPPAAGDPLLRRGLPPHNDPIPLARLAGFVGRHQELYELMQWFEEPGRLAYALHGVGGIGKTTLALAVAVRQAHRFDALAFATAKERPDFGPREVYLALAGALRLQPDPSAAADPESAATHLLNERRFLLVLDNLETAGAEARRSLARILDGIEPAAGSRVLLTLRPQQADPLTRCAPDQRRLDALDEASALRLAWELAAARSGFPAPPAAPEPAGGEKTRLERVAARAFLRGVPLTWIAAFERLAGLAFRHPKMIELAIGQIARHPAGDGWAAATARLEALKGKELSAALDEMIGTMVDDLAASDPQALAVLHAALVFEGGAPLPLLREVVLGRETAEGSDEALEFEDGPLRAALDSNLLVAAGGRCDLDPPVRAYLERFRPPEPGVRYELEMRHGRALVPVLGAVDEALLRGEVSLAAIPEWANLTAAWARLADRVPADRPSCELILQHATHWGNALLNTHDPRRETWLAAALAAALAVGSRLGEASTLQAIGDVLQFRNHLDDALDHYHRALEAFRAVGDRLGEANTLKAIGDVLQFRKPFDDALDHYHLALEAFRAVDDRLGEANCRATEGEVALLRGDQAAADDLLAEAVGIYEAIGSRYSVPAVIGNYGWTLLRAGRRDDGQPYLLRAAELFEAMGLSDYADRHRRAAKATMSGPV